jgi:hypothetical protein
MMFTAPYPVDPTTLCLLHIAQHVNIMLCNIHVLHHDCMTGHCGIDNAV